MKTDWKKKHCVLMNRFLFMALYVNLIFLLKFSCIKGIQYLLQTDCSPKHKSWSLFRRAWVESEENDFKCEL